MNPALADVADRILYLAMGSLAQANHHAVFSDPGTEHRDYICVLNAAHAGELFLKAAIAKEHPLLIFKDLFSLDDKQAETLDLDRLIKRGRTHDFEKLPQVLWATTGLRVANMDCFERLRAARNSIQHFCAPEGRSFRALSLEFIYTVIDPLIASEFGLFAIEYHEDFSVGYDHVVGHIVRSGLKFSIPPDFNLTEISLAEMLEDATPPYRDWIKAELEQIGKLELLQPKKY